MAWPKGVRRLRWIAVSIVVFFAACLLSVGWQPPRNRVEGAISSSSDPGSPTEVFARGWLQSNRVSRGEEVHFWISFVNVSQHEIQDLRLLHFQTPGFVAESPCWQRGAQPICLVGAPALPARLKPGASLTVLGGLRATSWWGHYSLSAVFGWRNAAGDLVRKGLLLGPIEVTYPLAESASDVVQRAYSAGKDLGLPLVIAVLTYLFQAREQRRKDDLQEVERRNREARERIDKKRVEVQQVWRQLLRKHLEDAQHYYLPISSKLTYLDASMASLPGQEKKCFYWLMSLMRQVKRMSDEIGGIHFRSPKAEEVWGTAWRVLRDSTEKKLGEIERSSALDLMTAGESLAKFEARFSDELFRNLQQKFINWIGEEGASSFCTYQPLVKILFLVLDYEVNQPFEQWYGEPVKFPTADLREACNALGTGPSLLRADEVKCVRDALESYLQAVPPASSGTP